MSVLNDILDFSKIEAGKVVLETLDFDLHTTLEDLAEMLAFNAHEKGLELTCQVAPQTPFLLRGDPGRLRQVLVNLLGNAIKFTHQGEIAISVELASEDERTATLHFAITDTGIGIKPHQANDLFLPFVRADGSVTRNYGGTGLGLAISKQLAELMGGQIGVESAEGKGSKFWFTTVFEKQPGARPPATAVCAGLRGARVLVVDNHARNGSLVATLLKSWGCRCNEAVDADSALNALQRAAQDGDCFRIALLDLDLPGLNGEELGRRIAGDPQLNQTALLGMCPLGRHGDLGRFHRAGFAGYVLKPVFENRSRAALACGQRPGSR